MYVSGVGHVQDLSLPHYCCCYYYYWYSTRLLPWSADPSACTTADAFNCRRLVLW